MRFHKYFDLMVRRLSWYYKSLAVSKQSDKRALLAQLRGRSQTTLTSFCLSLTTYPPTLTFSKYLINVDKKSTFLDYLPTSSCQHSLWTPPYYNCTYLKFNLIICHSEIEALAIDWSIQIKNIRLDQMLEKHTHKKNWVRVGSFWSAG